MFTSYEQDFVLWGRMYTNVYAIFIFMFRNIRNKDSNFLIFDILLNLELTILLLFHTQEAYH